MLQHPLSNLAVSSCFCAKLRLCFFAKMSVKASAADTSSHSLTHLFHNVLIDANICFCVPSVKYMYLKKDDSPVLRLNF